MIGRLADQRDFIPVYRWEGAGAVESMAGSGGVRVDVIHLPILAAGGPDPVIQSIGEIAQHGVGIVSAKAGEEHLLRIGLAIAIGIFEEDDVGRLGDDDAAVGTNNTLGNVEAFGEDGDLVRLAIT